MAGTRLRPDDDIRRIRNVWLGPTGMAWPVQATYIAWGVFVCVLIGLLLFEAVTPMHVSVFPAWEIAISMVVSTLVTGAIDYDKPLVMLPRVMGQHLATLAAQYQRRAPKTHVYKPMRRVRVRNREIM